MKYFDPNTLFKEKDKKLKFAKEIIREFEDKIPKNIGEMLINGNNEDSTILIHRLSGNSLEDLFDKGLIIDGFDLESCTSRYNDNIELLRSINTTENYKEVQNGKLMCAIMKVPNTSLQYEKGKTKPILMVEPDQSRELQTVLLSEYILGVIEYQDGKIIGFSENKNYRDVHDYKNDGLLCPEETIWDYKVKNNMFSKTNEFKTDKEINETIIQENNQYMGNNSNFQRTAEEIKEYSQRGMILSRFKNAVNKFKNFILENEENTKDGQYRE